jgi:hypothetical protein
MTSVTYSVETNEVGTPALYRTVTGGDGSELLKVPTDMAEVRSTSPETLSSYLNALSDLLTSAATHLSDAEGSPNDDTYRLIGVAYSSLGLFLATFDENLLPPRGE